MPTIHNLQNNASALALWARRIGIVDAPTNLNIVNYADVADTPKKVWVVQRFLELYLLERLQFQGGFVTLHARIKYKSL